jgi:hypothetical protein
VAASGKKPNLNLTGDWSGEFSYPRNMGPTTPFLANIQDEGGHLSGTIIEPAIRGGETMKATIAGHRQGSSVDFTKTYQSTGRGYDTPVDYVGSLSGDGNTVSGVWSLFDLDGTFEMRREAVEGEEVEEEAEVELPEPVLVDDRSG